MFAYETVVIGRRRVAIGAVVLQRTVSLQMSLAYWSVWIDAKAVFATEEIGEVEGEAWL